jgi:RNA binding exosome subunit
LKGHYGNPILLFKFETKDGDLIQKFVENLASSLSRSDKEGLSLDFERYVDSAGVLYLRFDKQSALLKHIKFQEEDPIKVKLKFGIPKEAIFKVCKKLGLVV